MRVSNGCDESMRFKCWLGCTIESLESILLGQR